MRRCKKFNFHVLQIAKRRSTALHVHTRKAASVFARLHASRIATFGRSLRGKKKASNKSVGVNITYPGIYMTVPCKIWN